MLSPALMNPFASASSIMLRPMRSLTAAGGREEDVSRSTQRRRFRLSLLRRRIASDAALLLHACTAPHPTAPAAALSRPSPPCTAALPTHRCCRARKTPAWLRCVPRSPPTQGCG